MDQDLERLRPTIHVQADARPWVVGRQPTAQRARRGRGVVRRDGRALHSVPEIVGAGGGFVIGAAGHVWLAPEGVFVVRGAVECEDGVGRDNAYGRGGPS